MGSDFGRMLGDAIVGMIILALVGGVVIGGLIVASIIYLIPWIGHHLSISWL